LVGRFVGQPTRTGMPNIDKASVAKPSAPTMMVLSALRLP
jgi:hypothetical protein